MKTKDLQKLGIQAGRCAEAAKQILHDAHAAGRDMPAVTADLARVAAEPAAFVEVMTDTFRTEGGTQYGVSLYCVCMATRLALSVNPSRMCKSWDST